MIMHGIVVGHLSHTHSNSWTNRYAALAPSGAAFEYDTAATYLLIVHASVHQVELPPNSCLRIPNNQTLSTINKQVRHTRPNASDLDFHANAQVVPGTHSKTLSLHVATFSTFWPRVLPYTVLLYQ